MKVLELSHYIIDKCVREGEPISRLQLQRILYFIQVHWLKKFNTPIFRDEPIEAWGCGPVVFSIECVYCGYGADAILSYYDNIEIAEIVKEEIEEIIKRERLVKPWREDTRIFGEGTPWETTYKKAKQGKGIWEKADREEIRWDLMKERGIE